MALTITDTETYRDASGTVRVLTGPRFTVRAQSLAAPVFQRSPTSGPYLEDEASVRPASVDTSSGAWTLVLPWGSETRSGVSTWSITRMNGTVVQGSVPEGISGPLTVDDLLFGLSSLARADGGTDPYPNWTIAPGQAAAEPVAIQPAVFRNREDWQAWVDYLPGDMVDFGALTWVARQPSTGEQPPTAPVGTATWGLAAMNSADAMFSYFLLFDDPLDPDYIMFPDGEYLIVDVVDPDEVGQVHRQVYLIGQGPLSARPATNPGVPGRLYRQTDATPNVWWQDTGTAWEATAGGTAAPGTYGLTQVSDVHSGSPAMAADYVDSRARSWLGL